MIRVAASARCRLHRIDANRRDAGPHGERMNTLRIAITTLCIGGALLAATVTARAGERADRDADQLTLYRAHAGAPVDSIAYAGRFLDWTPLGDSALALWTRPSKAWLVEFYSSCTDLDFSQRIAVRGGMTGRISARFDSITVLPTGMAPSFPIPCRIKSIQPLDVKAIKLAEKAAREGRQDAAPASPPEGAPGVSGT